MIVLNTEGLSDEFKNTAYTYKAKEINWRTSTKDEKKQYVTGNIVTANNRYFIVNPEIVTDCGLTGLSFDSGFTEIDKDTIEPVIKPVIDKKKEVLIKVHSELIDLVDSTTNEELAALCNACDYDYDALIDYAKKYKEFFIGKDSPEEIDEIDR